MVKLRSMENFKKVFKALKQSYGNSYAWTEVREVLSSESKNTDISEKDVHDPFKNLIIGILSQNTNDRNCTKAYIGLAKRTQINPQSLFSLSELEIREAIKPGGLYNLKAKRIKDFTRIIMKKYGGDITSIIAPHNPEKTRENLLKLKGIGPKTADVFISECLDFGVIAIDTNIDRVVKRLGFVSSNAGYYETKNALEKEISPKERLRAHELLIRLGRDYCRASNPLCKKCPLGRLCEKKLHLPAKKNMFIDKIKKELRAYGNKERAKVLSRFFKTGKGEYGEGDVFLGVKAPDSKKIIQKYYKETSLQDIQVLLLDKIHEYRSIALGILKKQYEKADEKKKRKIVKFYLKNTKNVNNWDLVDCSAPHILGNWLLAHQKERKILYKLACSKNLWERRISILSTLAFIRQKQFEDVLKISEILIRDKHDLIHKAVGWMLRETGKRDQKTEEGFLRKYRGIMPRTMLRYAIERFPEKKRKFYMIK